MLESCLDRLPIMTRKDFSSTHLNCPAHLSLLRTDKLFTSMTTKMKILRLVPSNLLKVSRKVRWTVCADSNIKNLHRMGFKVDAAVISISTKVWMSNLIMNRPRHFYIHLNTGLSAADDDAGKQATRLYSFFLTQKFATVSYYAQCERYWAPQYRI